MHAQKKLGDLFRRRFDGLPPCGEVAFEVRPEKIVEPPRAVAAVGILEHGCKVGEMERLKCFMEGPGPVPRHPADQRKLGAELPAADFGAAAPQRLFELLCVQVVPGKHRFEQNAAALQKFPPFGVGFAVRSSDSPQQPGDAGFENPFVAPADMAGRAGRIGDPRRVFSVPVGAGQFGQARNFAPGALFGDVIAVEIPPARIEIAAAEVTAVFGVKLSGQIRAATGAHRRVQQRICERTRLPLTQRQAGETPEKRLGNAGALALFGGTGGAALGRPELFDRVELIHDSRFTIRSGFRIGAGPCGDRFRWSIAGSLCARLRRCR